MCVDQNHSTPKNGLTTKGTNLAALSLPQFKFMPSNKDAILTHGWLVTESNPEKMFVIGDHHPISIHFYMVENENTI